jgi:hypothetical protein
MVNMEDILDGVDEIATRMTSSPASMITFIMMAKRYGGK